MPYTLVIVDMQHAFTASRSKPVRRNCITTIKQAIKDKASIVFVEYKGYKDTISTLTKPVKTPKVYRKVCTIVKNDQDGGEPLHQAILRRHFPKTHIKVCGVNTDQCVYATTKTLAKKLPNSTIEVISKACNSECSHQNGLSMLKRIDNVKIV